MTAPWWEGRLIGFDLETTHPDPEEARIVTAAVAACGGGLATEAFATLADPGVEIPEEATAVHGVSTEKARGEGAPLEDVVTAVIGSILQYARQGFPLVVFNARYDLTVADRECRRLGMVPLQDQLAAEGVPLFVVDPLVCDKWLDPFRPSYPHRTKTPEEWEAEGVVSSRKLEGMCRHYGAVLEGAHDATFDAVAACRLAYRVGQRGTVVRRIRRNYATADAREKQQLEAVWVSVRRHLPGLHEMQKVWAAEQAAGLARYWREQIAKGVAVPGDPDEVRGEWPLIPA